MKMCASCKQPHSLTAHPSLWPLHLTTSVTKVVLTKGYLLIVGGSGRGRQPGPQAPHLQPCAAGGARVCLQLLRKPPEAGACNISLGLLPWLQDGCAFPRSYRSQDLPPGCPAVPGASQHSASWQLPNGISQLGRAAKHTGNHAHCLGVRRAAVKLAPFSCRPAAVRSCCACT